MRLDVFERLFGQRPQPETMVTMQQFQRDAYLAVRVTGPEASEALDYCKDCIFTRTECSSLKPIEYANIVIPNSYFAEMPLGTRCPLLSSVRPRSRCNFPC